MDAKKAAIGTGYIVFFLWLVTPILLLIFFPDISQRGQFGDGYGFITSLFSGITIIGLIYTIYIQREEIKDTQENAAKQNKAILIQRFENTFFKMLELQSHITNDLSISRQVDMLQWKEFKGKVVVNVERENLLEAIGRSNDSLQTLIQRYIEYDKENHTQFDRYLSNLDSIHEFIISSLSLDNNEKQFYLGIFALQLDDHELALYFYYILLDQQRTSTILPHPDLDISGYVNISFLGHPDHMKLYHPELSIDSNCLPEKC